jgi:hypothetical protein
VIAIEHVCLVEHCSDLVEREWSMALGTMRNGCRGLRRLLLRAWSSTFSTDARFGSALEQFAPRPTAVAALCDVVTVTDLIGRPISIGPGVINGHTRSVVLVARKRFTTATHEAFTP